MNKKIIVVSHILDRSGAPISLLNIVKELSSNYDIYVLSMLGGEFKKEYEQYSKEIYILPQRSIAILNKIKKVIAIMNFIKRVSPSFIIINTSVNDLAVFASWLSRKKFLIYVRESENMLNSVRKKYLLKLADHIIAVSNETKKWITKYVQDSKISVVYNGIDFSNQSNIDFVHHHNEDYIISIIGHMQPRKGIDMFLELILKLSSQAKNFKFMIIGDFGNVSEKEEFYQGLKNHNLEDKIIITGIVENVYKYIAKSTIVVMMSREEALPRTVMEASYMKKPVVAFDTAGTKELLPNKEFIVPQYDIEIFASKIMYIIQNDKFEELGNKNYEYVKHNFDLKEQIEKIKYIITDITHK